METHVPYAFPAPCSTHWRRVIRHFREHISTALDSSGSVLYTTALTTLCHFTWPTISWLSCCCSQLLPLCYNTTNS
ncbi:unnamed protein product [Staurois parvus]|uniref:Uncharacterized protein n=1 Tax=Staurois parvus TaxID=386267 RepID=A0ABN9EQM7_9NEOB|nr:unnamed protein product [Staurois parvus]